MDKSLWVNTRLTIAELYIKCNTKSWYVIYLTNWPMSSPASRSSREGVSDSAPCNCVAFSASNLCSSSIILCLSSGLCVYAWVCVCGCVRVCMCGEGKGSLQLAIAGPTLYASRRSRMRDTVKLTVCVCVCVSVPAVTAQRLQCDEN